VANRQNKKSGQWRTVLGSVTLEGGMRAGQRLGLCGNMVSDIVPSLCFNSSNKLLCRYAWEAHLLISTSLEIFVVTARTLVYHEFAWLIYPFAVFVERLSHQRTLTQKVAYVKDSLRGILTGKFCK
jgi:hypothetical protein